MFCSIYALEYNKYLTITNWLRKGYIFAVCCCCYYCCFCFCCVFTLMSQTRYLSWNFAIPFAMLIHLVNFRHCKICYRLYGYQDTDLVSLKKSPYLFCDIFFRLSDSVILLIVCFRSSRRHFQNILITYCRQFWEFVLRLRNHKNG